jgi:hypothetical protein
VETVYKVKTRQIVLNSLTEKIKIWCFGDVHRFTRSCDDDRWKWFLKCAKETMDKNTYFLGLGDYQEFASSKEQKILKSAALHGSTIDDFDDTVKKRNRIMSTEMAFMKPNLLGLIDGNHNWVFNNGQTATEDLADRLMTEYLGWLCHFSLHVVFKYPGSEKHINVYILACHGKAGGKTAGASVNQLDDVSRIFPLSDIVIMGHDHQRFARPIDILIPVQDHGSGETFIKQKRQFLCRSGSFKKAYMPDSSGYEVGRLLRPADLGALQLEIGFHREQKYGKDNITTDIIATI